MKKINKDKFIEITKSSDSMAQASVRLNMHFNTFKRYAEIFGVYNPNQGGKGTKKPKKEGKKKYALNDIILYNKYPYYSTNKLRIRLIKIG